MPHVIVVHGMRYCLPIIIQYLNGWCFDLHAQLLVLLSCDIHYFPCIPALVFGPVYFDSITTSKHVLIVIICMHIVSYPRGSVMLPPFDESGRDCRSSQPHTRKALSKEGRIHLSSLGDKCAISILATERRRCTDPGVRQPQHTQHRHARTIKYRITK